MIQCSMIVVSRHNVVASIHILISSSDKIRAESATFYANTLPQNKAFSGRI